MAARRVIQDSDDEESDFHPESPIVPVSVPAGDESLQPWNGEGQRSTDSAFFRSVYEEQLNGAARVRAAELDIIATPSGAPQEAALSPVNSFLQARPKDDNPGSGEVIDLTTSTTPRRSNAGNALGIWDFPSSGETTPKPRSSKTYGKRKRGLRSSPPSLDPTAGLDAADAAPTENPATEGWMSANSAPDEDALPMPAQKRRKRASRRDSASGKQDVGLVSISGDGELSKYFDKNPTSVDYGTLVSETRPVLEVSIAQRRLTSSQRKEYRVVSSLDNDEHYPLAGEIQKSSGAATLSTIAYPTPSRLRPSRSGETPESPDKMPVKASSLRRKGRASKAGEAVDYVRRRKIRVYQSPTDVSN